MTGKSDGYRAISRNEENEQLRDATRRAWQEHTWREIGMVLTLALFPVMIFVVNWLSAQVGVRLHGVWFVAHALVLATLHIKLHRFRCPGCQNQFFVRKRNWVVRNIFASRCLHCGLQRGEVPRRERSDG